MLDLIPLGPALPGALTTAEIRHDGLRGGGEGASDGRHRLPDHEPPTGSEAVKAVLRGIRRTIGSAKQRKAPATADLIGRAFRRSELCALEVADLTEVPDGLRILIRRSKGDQEGQGQEVAVPRA